MAIFNKITEDQVHELNRELYKREQDFYQRDDVKECPEYELEGILSKTYEKFTICRDNMNYYKCMNDR